MKHTLAALVGLAVSTAGALPATNRPGVLPEADRAAALAEAGGFQGLPAGSKVQSYRTFILACPRPGRPFSGYFMPRSPVYLKLLWSDGFSTDIKFDVRPQSVKRPADAEAKLPAQAVAAQQAYLECEGLPLQRIHVKPNLDAVDDDVLARLDPKAFPPADETLLHLRAEAVEGGVAFTVNGSYAGTLKRPARPVQLTILARGREAFLDVSQAEPDPGDYRELNLDLRSRGELKAGLALDAPLPVPMRTAVVRGLDLRKAAPCGVRKSSVKNRDLSRTAFDGLPMSYLFSVPAEPYTRAWVLCSAIPDAAHKPSFRLVMTRYAKYGRDDLSQAAVDVDLAAPDRPLRNVGRAELELDGTRATTDVYLVEIPLDHGRIQDLLYTDPHGMLPFTDYLDIDLQGPGPRRSTDPAVRAAVAVYGLTLERAPVAMRVLQAEAGNAFHNGEKPRIPVTLAARKAGRYMLSWTIRDVDGNPVGARSRRVTLTQGQTEQRELPLRTGGPGWFGVEIGLADDAGNVFSTYQAAVAVLRPDTRQAGYDSPYTTWWFGDGSHQTPADPDRVAPYLFKAGIRATNNKNHPEAILAPWKMTLSQIPYFGNRIYTDANLLNDDPRHWEQMAEAFAVELNQYADRFPHCRYGILLHESYRPDYPVLPAAVLGRPFQPYDKERETLERARLKAVAAMSAVYRKQRPDIAVIFGNSVWAQGIVESFATHGFDPAQVDFLGTEAPGGTVFPPESFYAWNCAGHSYLLRETSRLAGWNVPVTACYEWTYRTSKELGPLKQAQWYLRDAMVAYAYGFRQIPLGGACDYATPYNNGGAYGQVGLCTRMFQPKPAYVAAAVLTRILDRASFERQVPTDDAALFAFAFSRASGGKVYTAWVPSGSALCEFAFDGGLGSVESEDSFGRRTVYRTLSGTVRAEVTPSLRYFVTDRTLKSVTTLQRRYAPDSVEPPALVSAGFAANEVAVADAPHPLMEEYPGCSYVSNNLLFVAERRVPAVVADAADAERGMCLAVRFDLAGLPADHWNHGGYATLRLAKPIEIPAQANGIGLWVKGNASLGRLAWELTDAKGRVFISNGTPRDGAVLLNAGYENEFTHTGWRFLKMALTPKYAIPQSWFSMHWHNAEGTAMTPPFKVTALVVSSSQKLPRIDGFAPVRDQEIRLGRMAAYE